MVTYDNTPNTPIRNDVLDNLLILAGSTIEDLVSESGGNILIFPQSFEINGDEIDKQHIFSVNEENMTLSTGNIMGFIGYRGTSVSIRSRFAKEDGKDYFLHYMLQKVFAINLFDLDHLSNEEPIFDFLIYMFPYFLNKALRQGLYKEYQTRRYNDSNVRGSIDVDRHLQYNIPFIGNIAYNTREFAYDNHITELIRHTIEYISQKEEAQSILSMNADTIENVRIIRHSTPNYIRRDRGKVMAANIKPVVHPYFYEYRELQLICMKILHHEELKYGHDNHKIHGVLFDGAWLWEEYLNTVLRETNFEHPKNKERKGAIYLFEGKMTERYPDFYRDDFVLDAKYKRYEWRDVASIDRDDLNQIVTYMWILKAHNGGFVFPCEGYKSVNPRKLVGYDGHIGLYGLNVNKECKNYEDFKKEMHLSEEDLKWKIETGTL